MELRKDPLTGVTVAVVGSRQERPNRPSADCPFCVGGLEAPEPYDVRAFVNRWPSFPDDRCEVVLYTPDHDATFRSLGVDGARTVIDLWAERTETLGARDDVDYVLVFENKGAEVGATIPHPHGQIFAYDRVPDHPARELDGDGPCPLCEPVADDHVVASAPGWTAWVPWASPDPYGLLLAPSSHVGSLPDCDGASRDALAAVLVEALGRLDRLFDAPMPYMMWFHQRPTDGAEWPRAHVHLHVAPVLRAPGVMRFAAGGEQGSGLFVNPVTPEDAAAALRG